MASCLVRRVALDPKLTLLVASLVILSVSAVGCSSDQSAPAGPQPSGPDVKAEVHSTPSIAATVSFSSPARTTTEIETAGVCMPALLVYRDTSATMPVWDQQRWYNTHIGGCKWMLEKVTVPGQTSTPGVSARDILGDSLPAGMYAARVRVIIGHYSALGGSSFTTVIDETREVAAGLIAIAP
jgi:hypothetical protein